MAVDRVVALFLLVRDLARARAFYEALLGRPADRAGTSEVRFDMPGLSLTLHADLSDAERERWRVPPEQGPRGWGLYVTLSTPDVDAAARIAASRGGSVSLAPQDTPWGTRICLVRDPDGYWLELSRPREETPAQAPGARAR